MDGPEDSAAIRILGAAKHYGARGTSPAVADVSLRVTSGSIHGLLGPNGAGKTTTLKMLLGLVRPTAGRFEMLGEPVSPRVRARVGFLPEQPYFPPLLTAKELLLLHGRLSGMSKDEVLGRASDLLARVGLEGKEGVRLAKFSRGMLQRAGIAQALIASPEVIVLDEPASGLDPVGQRDVRNLMAELASEGATVLLSSHQLSEVEAVCDEVTILNRGYVAAEGRIDDLLGVSGRTSIRVRGDRAALPAEIQSLMEDVAVAGSVWIFSIPDTSVRAAIDILDDNGWTIESVVPKRESLEDYFAQMLASPTPSAGKQVAT
ncbi:MAG: ABC transporter ATP-binding protein [Coriobacteriia bacterium]|jgi:ABC-2 type transport system ATP-binding protein|nr:ABC transporter ATP-binding protein [Coriobacteriia bacterium]